MGTEVSKFLPMGKIRNFLTPTDEGGALINANSGFFYWVTVIFVANPLTMFFWNLFAPRKASEFIYTWVGSGKKTKGFYRFLANLMPFRWNKYWIQRAGVEHYSLRQQVKYYLQYDTTSETLRRLNLDAVDTIYKSQKDNEFVRGQIYEFRRPSELVITSLFLGKSVGELRKFSQYGPFGKNAAQTLVNLAKCEVLESKESCRKFPLTDYLADYVRVFKMDADMLERLRDFQGSARVTKIWFDRIEPAIVAFQQRMFTREQSKNNDVRPWRGFCKGNKVIYPEAQKVMSLKQLLIFYETGHRLSPDTVLYFLKDGYPARFDMMLRWEKNKEIFSTGEAKEIVDENPRLSGVYKKFINQTPKPQDYGKKSQRDFLPPQGGNGKKKPSDSGTRGFGKHGAARNI